ncbi:MAG: glutamyl-tRNA reductase, partial [Chromatiales bacterium]|nr:glutamyl-tRNA reductase [Chromatiales bacterium]
GDLSAQTAMVIGAGETIELATRHLAKSGLTRLIVANRTVDNARRLAAEFGGYAISLDEISHHLAEADVIISSTGSQEPVLRAEDARRAVIARRHKPIFMVDIAVPRDIEAEAGELEDVYLYTVDDLQHVIEENRRNREEAAKQAEDIIEAQVPHLMGWLDAQDVVPLIKALRRDALVTKDEVLGKALAQIEAGKSAQQALTFLANTLTNKLIHQPTTALREAGGSGRDDVVEAARTLFGIDEAHQDD